MFGGGRCGPSARFLLQADLHRVGAFAVERDLVVARPPGSSVDRDPVGVESVRPGRSDELLSRPGRRAVDSGELHLPSFGGLPGPDLGCDRRRACRLRPEHGRFPDGHRGAGLFVGGGRRTHLFRRQEGSLPLRLHDGRDGEHLFYGHRTLQRVAGLSYHGYRTPRAAFAAAGHAGQGRVPLRRPEPEGRSVPRTAFDRDADIAVRLRGRDGLAVAVQAGSVPLRCFGSFSPALRERGFGVEQRHHPGPCGVQRAAVARHGRRRDQHSESCDVGGAYSPPYSGGCGFSAGEFDHGAVQRFGEQPVGGDGPRRAARDQDDAHAGLPGCDARQPLRVERTVGDQSL